MQKQIINNRPVKSVIEQKTEDQDETSSESDESRPLVKEAKTIGEKNKHYTATVKNKRDKEGIHNGHRITDNDNAAGRNDSETNRNTERTK